MSTLSETVPKKPIKSKTKPLCCGNEFSDQKAEVSEPLSYTQVPGVKTIKGNTENRIG
jgi:hypothetical protein